MRLALLAAGMLWPCAVLAEGDDMGAGWVLYPPLSTAAEASEFQIGQTRITGRNPAMATPGKPDWITYDHFETRFMHRFEIVSHLPASGS